MKFSNLIVANLTPKINPLHIEKGGSMVHNILKLCKEKGISVPTLCDKAGLSVGVIYHWDKNKPNVFAVYRVAKVLGTTVEELLRGEV